MRRSAFTMIELIFVIVVMGIIGKFGVEFLAQAYKNFIFTNVNNTLQSDTSYAVEVISKRLENRVRDSVIARKTTTSATTIPDTVPINDAVGDSYTVLEWISVDEEGFRGDYKPNWSGIIDLFNTKTTTTVLYSPETNTTAIDTLINNLSNGDSGIEDAALYSIGSNGDVLSSYGWEAGSLAQDGIIHPITAGTDIDTFISSNSSDFSGSDISEYYKLVWTANALVWSDDGSGKSKGDLTFYYDYQPWNGETIADAKSALLMENVSTFKFRAIGSILKIQLCVKSTLVEEYALCKEKTIF